MIYGLFMFGGFWFWALLALVTMALLVEVANERWFLATLTIFGTVACLQFFGDVPVFTWLYENPGLTLLGVAGYFVAGTVWAFVKWYLHVKEQREEYEDDKQEFLRGKGVLEGVIPEELREAWARTRASPYQFSKDISLEFVLSRARENDAPPSARNHKSRITQWMAFWPWSLAWSLIDDFVRRAFEHIYRQIAGTLQRISDRVFAGVSEDFNVPPKETNES